MRWSALPGLRRWNREEKQAHGRGQSLLVEAEAVGDGGRLAATAWHGRPISSLG
jgi:hypothetical protein